MYTGYSLKLILCSAVLFLSFSKPLKEYPQKVYEVDNNNLLLGNPSQATHSALVSTNYLMDKSQYTLSFNSTRNIPNWVSWHIDKNDLGPADRQDDFRADNTLPSSWYRVRSASYTSSGFDRGHNCPSADRTATIAANSATFLMTNMIPQAPNHNRRAWANLEEYTRSLVESGYEVYVIMGSYGQGGIGSKGYKTTIDGGKIVVPSHIWKVIVIIPNGNHDLSRINKSTRVIAVDIPNDNSISSDWHRYYTSVDHIEKSTGYDLFNNLSESLQSTLESRIEVRN